MPNDELAKLKENIQAYQESGMNPLLALANHKNKEILFQELKKNGALEELFGKKDESKYNIIEKLYEFLYNAFGAQYKKRDVNALDQNGQSPLHHLFGSKEIVQKLIEEFGADLNIENKFGETPLMKAAEYGYGNTAVYLLDKGADPKAVDNDGKSLLHKLAEQFKARDLAGQLQVVQALNEKGMLSELLEQKDKEGKAPLDYAKNSEKGVSQILVDVLNKPEELKDPELQNTIEILGALKTIKNPPPGISDELKNLENLDGLKKFGKSDLVKEAQDQIELESFVFIEDGPESSAPTDKKTGSFAEKITAKKPTPSENTRNY